MLKRLSFYLLLVILFSGCSKRIERGKDLISREQVELEKLDPLAQFILKEDSLNIFETFSNFPEANKNLQLKIPTTKEKSLPSNVYFVQVGLTDSFDEISSLKTQISNLFPGEKVTIEYDTPFYRIIIGPFNSRSEANEIFSILERKNFPSLRIRIENLK